MTPNQKLHQLGQSLWLDNITRSMLDEGTIKRYIDELEVTGLTSNPSIFKNAIVDSNAYDKAIADSNADSDEDLFFELAIADLKRAAKLFADIHQQTDGVDGWVSLEVSPLLADDTEATKAAARDLHARADCDNLFIKIPGTHAGLGAIEESIFAGVPVNVTLLFSRAQTLAAAEAWMRAIERRIEAGLDAHVSSVLSLFVSRWDVAVADKVDHALHDKLGIAIAQRTYSAYANLCRSPRWQKLAAHGVKPQRLLWASTSIKDPQARDTLYVEALAAADTINTMPDKTLKAFADHGRMQGAMPQDGGNAEATLASFEKAGIDLVALAGQLQREGASKFSDSWHALLADIHTERQRLSGNGGN